MSMQTATSYMQRDVLAVPLKLHTYRSSSRGTVVLSIACSNIQLGAGLDLDCRYRAVLYHPLYADKHHDWK
jgi:hypothetical protein